jgi:hypothetical protein
LLTQQCGDAKQTSTCLEGGEAFAGGGEGTQRGEITEGMAEGATYSLEVERESNRVRSPIERQREQR